MSAGYFWNRFRDLILFAPSPTCPPSAFGTCPQNIQQAKTQGFEAAFSFLVLPGLETHGQYTYTLTRDLATGRRLPRWPVDQASLGVTYQPIEPVRVNVDYRFVGARNNDPLNSPSQRLGSFGVVNVSATYDVTTHLQVFGRIDNLFNQDYEEILFFGTPIRSVFGGVKITL